MGSSITCWRLLPYFDHAIDVAQEVLRIIHVLCADLAKQPKPKPKPKAKAKPKPKPKPKPKAKAKAKPKPKKTVSKNISNIHNLRAQIDNFYKI